MIELKAELMVGKGLHRECYIHPDNPERCIKVVVLRGEQETLREQSYYKLLEKRGINWDLLPRFYGVEATSMGPGAVFDLIRDSDGNVGKTFADYFESDLLTRQHYQGLADSLKKLKEYLIGQNIITMSIKPKNIIYQRLTEKTGRAILIDNIGNSDTIPIATYSRLFGHIKMTRKWNKFITVITRDYPENSAVKALAEVI